MNFQLQHTQFGTQSIHVMYLGSYSQHFFEVVKSQDKL